MAKPNNPSNHSIQLDASLWMKVGAETLGGHNRVRLLQAIAEHGSITQAAKAIGMSYKAAWDSVETMNTIAAEPLVERVVGGRGGGATRLTQRGAQLVDRFTQIENVHQRFVQMLSDEAVDLTSDANLLKVLNMKTSARNQFYGVVSAVHAGAVNDEIELAITASTKIVAVVTQHSAESLGLQVGNDAFALIKASSVIIATDLDNTKLSARNQLPGIIVGITPGAVNTEVTLELDGGGFVTAMVTSTSVQNLGLKLKKRAMAVFKASSVIVGTIN